MIKDKYLKQITNVVNQFILNKKVQAFLFGSSARKDRFGDCDIGILGDIKENDVRRIKEALEESTLPYKVDVIDFNNVSQKFKDNVFKQPIIWIKP